MLPKYDLDLSMLKKRSSIVFAIISAKQCGGVYSHFFQNYGNLHYLQYYNVSFHLLTLLFQMCLFHLRPIIQIIKLKENEIIS